MQTGEFALAAVMGAVAVGRRQSSAMGISSRLMGFGGCPGTERRGRTATGHLMSINREGGLGTAARTRL